MGKSLLLFVFLFTMFHFSLFAQKKQQVQDFIDELKMNQGFLMEDQYLNDKDKQKAGVGWFQDNFLKGATLCNECNSEHNLDDYFEYLKSLQKRGSYTADYQVESVPSISERNVEAIIKKSVLSKGESLFSAKYKFTFLFDKQSGRLRLQKIESLSEDNHPKYCNPPKPNLTMPISIVGLGTVAFVSSFYFQTISDKHYQNYQNSYPLPQSDIDYLRANQNHHADLALKYSGITVATIGTSYLLVKTFSHRSKQRALQSAFLPIITPNHASLSFSYRF